MALLSRGVVALASLCLLSANAVAGAATTIERAIVTDLGDGRYSFTQGGYDGGAVFSGTFSGLDSNVDGRLVGDVNFGELTEFTAAFSGTDTIAAVSFDQTNAAFQIVYDLDGAGVLGDFTTRVPGESLQGFDTTGFEFVIGALVRGTAPCDGVNVCGFLRGPSPDLVPEPVGLALLGTGIALLGSARLRRR